MTTIDDKVKDSGAVKDKKPFYAEYSGHFLCVVAAEFADICKGNFCPPEANYSPKQLEIYHRICSAFEDITDYAKKLNDNKPLTDQEKEILYMLREIRVRHKLKVAYEGKKGNC